MAIVPAIENESIASVWIRKAVFADMLIQNTRIYLDVALKIVSTALNY